MKNIIITLSASILFVINTQAQTDVLYGVWVLNEGLQDWATGEMVEPASVGVYDMETGSFSTAVEFEGASFTTNILIEAGSAFVGADNKIVKINDSKIIEDNLFSDFKPGEILFANNLAK